MFIGTKIGYPSTIIRTLDKYIPTDDTANTCLMPYSSVLFNKERPHFSCELIKKLSSIRLYLYGNDYFISSEWSNFMITWETEIMKDEDNWCAFLENESILDQLKWNFSSKFAKQWQINCLTPINIIDLDKDSRFQSALRRAFITFNRRRLEVTAEIFEWYDQNIRNHHLLLQVKLNFY